MNMSILQVRGHEESCRRRPGRHRGAGRAPWLGPSPDLPLGRHREEASRPMPGDDRCPRPQLNATRAVTIAAAPEHIWPWLVQWGWNRAGFYSYDLLDNLGRLSARRILPQFQHLAVGDWVPMGGKPTPVHRLPGHPARTRHPAAVGKARRHLAVATRAGRRRADPAHHPAAQLLRLGQARHRDRADLDGARRSLHDAQVLARHQAAGRTPHGYDMTPSSQGSGGTGNGGNAAEVPGLSRSGRR